MYDYRGQRLGVTRVFWCTFRALSLQKVEKGLELIPPDTRPKGTYLIYLLYTQRNAEAESRINSV